jgi:nitrilase
MRVALAQAASVFLDPEATTDKALSLIAEAARGGAELIAFPETFLSGYPVWVSATDGARFDAPDQKEAYAHYLQASVEASGPELRAIAKAARSTEMMVYVGITERGEGSGRGTVYCTLAVIDPAKGVVSLHRKLMPTYEERLVWGIGDGAGLDVHEFAGTRIGGLNCWENWMPLARTALYAQGEEVHVSVWPGRPALTKDITRFIAREGRVFVLAASGVLKAKDIPASFPLRKKLLESGDTFLTGGSVAVSPEGEVIASGREGEEELVFADLDLTLVPKERHNFDPTGHYSRPDVFRLGVDKRRKTSAEFD